jgi:hypothetical protein
MSETVNQQPAQTNTQAGEGNAQTASATTSTETLLYGGGKEAATTPTETKQETTQEPKDQKEGQVESSEYNLKLPDDAFIDEKHVQAVSEYAKELKLTNEQAQKLIERDNTLLSSYVESQKQMLEQKTQSWVNELKTDKEFGGEAFTKNTELARRALDRFAPQELKQFLNETGFGNNPLLVKTFHKIGLAMSDDEFVTTGTQPSAPKPIEEVFYGSTNNN